MDQLAKLEAENKKLRAALHPFVYAYRVTNDAYGFDVGLNFVTANMISQPYIKMADYVAAFEAMGYDSVFSDDFGKEDK